MTKMANLPWKKKELEIFLKPGWKGGTQVSFPNEGDIIPGNIPADIIVVVEEEPHPLYRREGNNLFFKNQITLLAALTGLTLTIPHISGDEISIPIAGPINPGFQKVCPGKGYISQRDGSKGDLIIMFEILWPKNEFSEEQKKMLQDGPLGSSEYIT